MAIPVLLIGRSGSGKTYSLKNFKPEEVGILSVEKGRLPFKSDLKVVKVKSFADGEHTPAQANAARYSWLEMAIKSSKIKSLVIDDSQYLLSGELFDRAYEKGYDKFVDIAAHFRNLIHAINEMEEEDKIVYFLHHSELDADGREKVKTIGKMLDEKLCVEGLFPIVIDARVVQGEDGRPRHVFVTENDGTNLAKCPMGMLPPTMDNDLKAVDEAIREYWGMKPVVDAADDDGGNNGE